MTRDTAYGVVKTLESTDFVGSTYVQGYDVQRIVNEKQAVWVVFKARSAHQVDSFQYTPGGNWEDLDEDNYVIGHKDW